MKNKLMYIAISEDEVIAHILQSEKFGLVVIFFTEKLSLVNNLTLHNLETGVAEMDEELLDLILSPFPRGNNE